MANRLRSPPRTIQKRRVILNENAECSPYGKPLTPAEWLSIPDYASRYGVHRQTVRKWLAAGLLTVYQVGKVIRVKHQPPAERRHIKVKRQRVPL